MTYLYFAQIRTRTALNMKLHIYCEKSIWRLKELWPTVGGLSSHLGGEHVSNAVDRPSQQQASHQETEQHHVREEGAEVHHLSESQSAMLHSVAMDTHFTVALLHTQSHTNKWMNPKTALCSLVLNLWNLTKRGEDSMRFKDTGQKSFLQHFGESFRRCLW